VASPTPRRAGRGAHRAPALSAHGQALAGGGLQRFELQIIVGRPDVLDRARASPRAVHDLHRPSPDAVLTVRTYARHRRLRDPLSAQNQPPQRQNRRSNHRATSRSQFDQCQVKQADQHAEDQPGAFGHPVGPGNPRSPERMPSCWRSSASSHLDLSILPSAEFSAMLPRLSTATARMSARLSWCGSGKIRRWLDVREPARIRSAELGLCPGRSNRDAPVCGHDCSWLSWTATSSRTMFQIR